MRITVICEMEKDMSAKEKILDAALTLYGRNDTDCDFVKIMDELGYDVELTYKKKESL